MLARRMAEVSYNDDPIVRSLNALAPLACGNKEYLPLVKCEAQRTADLTMDDYQSWYYGYAMMLVAKYKLARTMTLCCLARAGWPWRRRKGKAPSARGGMDSRGPLAVLEATA